MEYQYYICDVFTDQIFGGNPLAVIPNATGLTTEQMQKIAREFNFSESTFVFPTERQGCQYQVRIFTPSREVPFAGHPNVGTAFVLDEIGKIALNQGDTAVFDEKAGIVPVIKTDISQGQMAYQLTAPEPLSLGEPLPVELLAEALTIEPDSIMVGVHQPLVASVGLAFIMVELSDTEVLSRCKINMQAFEKLHDLGVMPDIHAYVVDDDGNTIHSRMFAPLDGVPEDPATGSANCALAALLHHFSEDGVDEHNYAINQGVDMGRPSKLYATVTDHPSGPPVVKIAGQAVMFSSGQLII